MGEQGNNEAPQEGRLKGLLRLLWVAGSEALLGVVTVGVLSLLFLGALMVMFPKGTGLVDVYGGFVGNGRSGGARPGFTDGLEQPVVARITAVRRQVKDRPSDAVVWNASTRGMPVEHQHAVQTFARSGATIEVEGRGDIEMGENSLIVFRQPERGRSGERRRASIALLGGTLRGSVAAGDRVTGGVDILTANASTRFTGPDGKAADYSVSVGPDNSSTIKVMSGKAEITAGGERKVLESNEAVTVFPDSTIGAAVSLAPAPRMVQPAQDDKIVYGSVAPPVAFKWSRVPAAESYRLVIATDDALENVVYEGLRDGTDFDHGALDEGRYYWQVTAIRDGVEGRHSAVRSLALERDAQPPTLAVELFPTDDGELLVRGTTDRDAEIYAGEKTLTVSDSGVFEYRVSLSAGVNMIVIEAVDAVGNSAFYSEYVDQDGRPRRDS